VPYRFFQALQSYISKCEREGVNFDLDTIGAAAARSSKVIGEEFDKESVKSKKKSILLLVSLTIASILFAWLIRVIMCGEYV